MQTGKILIAQQQNTYILKFCGDVRVGLCSTIDALLDTIFANTRLQAIVIDLTETEGIDSTSLGLLAKIALQSRSRLHSTPTIISSNEDITRILLTMGFDQVFIIVKRPLLTAQQMNEVPLLHTSEQVVRDKVLEAHRILMDLNEHNREAFKSVVCALEQCAAEPNQAPTRH